MMSIERRDTILIVEDDQLDADMILRGFRKSEQNYNVKLYSDGDSAWRYLNDVINTEKQPDLIILDINLPRKSGIELLIDIRTKSAFFKIPVIVTTGSEREDDFRMALDAGANAVSAKSQCYANPLEFIRAIDAFWLKMCRI